MIILDRANTFIGHEEEVDEGLETTMRRNAFVAGFKEAIGIVKKMREAQVEQEMLTARLLYKRKTKAEFTKEDYNNLNLITNKMIELEYEVDGLMKEMEV